MFSKKIMLAAAVVAVASLAFADKAADKDPVLMTVDGKPVYKSEFMYLFNKNNSQQANPQTVDQYFDMFADYKRKVAEAERQHIDTTAQFLTEFNQYRAELAAPYMRDTAVLAELYRESYSHMTEDVKVSHIMLLIGQNADEMVRQAALADSLRNALVDGTAVWDSVVVKYSIDRGSNRRGGSMGWLGINRTPWAFEKAAYDTPVGQLSPVVNSGFGLHIVRPDARRANRGEVNVSHILKLTARKSPDEAAAAKAQIDSIYQLLADGADFATVAKQESEDPGSKAKGGQLDWFGSGVMVAEFDSVAFALKDGELSRPFATSYGYHIILKHGSRPVPTFDEAKDRITTAINNDERGTLPEKKFRDDLVSEFKGAVLDKGMAKVKKLIVDNGGYDSVAIARLKVSKIPVYTVAGKNYPVSDVMPGVAVTNLTDVDNALGQIRSAAETAIANKAYELGRDRLETTNADYRNLLNEYRDGILLFEVTNRNVWEKASTDGEGLDKFFRANKDKYKWTAPKYKGFIVFAANDSTMKLAEEYANSLGDKFKPMTFAADMRARFGKDVKVERVLAAKGDNAISDYLVFGGPRPDDSKIRWAHYFAFGGHIADQPEEVADVRGLVTTDYQNQLEKEWLEQLRKTHKVTINQKVRDSLK